MNEKVARLKRAIEQELPPAVGLLWTDSFLTVLNRNKDLDWIVPQFFLWLLETEFRYAENQEIVAALYRRWVAGEEPAVSEWGECVRVCLNVKSRAPWQSLWPDESAMRIAAMARAAFDLNGISESVPGVGPTMAGRMADKLLKTGTASP